MIFYKQTNKVLIILMTFFLVFTMINLINYYDRVAYHQRISNQYYTKEAVTLEGNLYRDFTDDLQTFFIDRGIVLYKLISPVEDIRVVLTSDDFTPPPLKEGRFFSKNDFLGESYYAVVGKGILPHLEVKEDNLHFVSGDIDYEVIGVMGYTGESLLDYTVFLGANFINIHYEGLYIVDGNDKSDIDYFLKNQSMLKNIEIIDKEFVNAQRILGLGNSGSIIFIFIVSVLALSYIVLILYWIKNSHREFFIRRMCGHPFNLILLSFWGDLLKLNIVGMVVGSTYLIVYSRFLHTSLYTLLTVVFYTLVSISGANGGLLLLSLVNKRNRAIYDKIR